MSLHLPFHTVLFEELKSSFEYSTLYLLLNLLTDYYDYLKHLNVTVTTLDDDLIKCNLIQQKMIGNQMPTKLAGLNKYF